MGQRTDIGQIEETRHPFDGVEPTEYLIDQLVVVRVVLQLQQRRLSCLDVLVGLRDKIQNQRRVFLRDRHGFGICPTIPAQAACDLL